MIVSCSTLVIDVCRIKDTLDDQSLLALDAPKRAEAVLSKEFLIKMINDVFTNLKDNLMLVFKKNEQVRGSKDIFSQFHSSLLKPIKRNGHHFFKVHFHPI